MIFSPKIDFTSFSNYFAAKKKKIRIRRVQDQVQQDIRNNIRMHKHFEFSQ